MVGQNAQKGFCVVKVLKIGGDLHFCTGGLTLARGEPARRAGNWEWSQPCHVGGVPLGFGVGPRAGTGRRRTLRRGGCAARRGGPLSFKKEGKEDRGKEVLTV